ncbi:sterol desaturase family protein [Rhodococcus sp. SGAir0479]|uniref:sterol desaturase family protein n=1 Tax=Rhodococcus sp. SGAir0479 TaxID=2567884 RepID=UPI0010CD0208|nr:sterol desaturase family protein [Rhodococcus sp. SGAir0479]QCQ91095.1 fatty acid hydroxylase family protein [Rhodococcus sp. SGAir0479]
MTTSRPTSPAFGRDVTLAGAAREFVRHPSPWIIGGLLAGALTIRLVLGGWTWADALVPVVMAALFPVLEWLIHVFVLHWRPKRIAGITIDPLLARKHRAHHGDPRNIPLDFIPTPVFVWLVPLLLATALLGFPRVELGLTFLIVITALGLAYEWTHFLIHTDYKPTSAPYRATWRHHRNHHYRNEHYWFTVTSSGTADRVFGTEPDPDAVEKSPTAKRLHGLDVAGA